MHEKEKERALVQEFANHNEHCRIHYLGFASFNSDYLVQLETGHCSNFSQNFMKVYFELCWLLMMLKLQQVLRSQPNYLNAHRNDDCHLSDLVILSRFSEDLVQMTRYFEQFDQLKLALTISLLVELTQLTLRD